MAAGEKEYVHCRTCDDLVTGEVRQFFRSSIPCRKQVLTVRASLNIRRGFSRK